MISPTPPLISKSQNFEHEKTLTPSISAHHSQYTKCTPYSIRYMVKSASTICPQTSPTVTITQKASQKDANGSLMRINSRRATGRIFLMRQSEKWGGANVGEKAGGGRGGYGWMGGSGCPAGGARRFKLMDQPTACSTPSNPLLIYCCSKTNQRTRGRTIPHRYLIGRLH